MMSSFTIAAITRIGIHTTPIRIYRDFSAPNRNVTANMTPINNSEINSPTNKLSIFSIIDVDG